MMKYRSAALLPMLTLAAAGLSLGGCEKADGEQGTVGEAAVADSNSDTVGEAIVADGNLSGIAELLSAADLSTTLAGPSLYTVFAPSDAALDALPTEVVAALKTPAAKPQLTSLLTAHIIPGTVTTSDIINAIESGGGRTQIRTMAGDLLTFAKSGDRITVTTPNGTIAEISGETHEASNGVVHVIDGVLLRS